MTSPLRFCPQHRQPKRGQMNVSQAEETPDTSLLKVLGNWDALALGFGAMIGFGWVVLTGGWIASAGTMGAVLAMVTGGVIMMVVGLTYA